MQRHSNHCRRASDLVAIRDGTRLEVAGLVTTRQRPGTAKGVVFVTLEDETGSINIIVWNAIFEKYRRAVISSRMMLVHGRLQRQSNVTHVIADQIKDISALLDLLSLPRRSDHPLFRSPAQIHRPFLTNPVIGCISLGHLLVANSNEFLRHAAAIAKSGWFSLRNLRCAAFTSSLLASGSTPSTA